MKKIITSAGLVVAGAASLHAQQYAPAPSLSSTETTKPWSIAATVRGFYDDNYATRPEAFARESWGYEVSPSFGLNFTLPQTYIGLSYVYGLRWYEDRPEHKYDQSHQVNVKLSHAFTERYKLDVSDSFVVAQEPELLDPASTLIALPLRSEGDNIRNYATANFSADLTELFGLTVGYANTFYDYDNAQYSATLDRMEHTILLNTRWQLLPTTVGIVGYQYGIVDYTFDGLLPGTPYRSDVKNRNSHYAYIGADHSFTPQLMTSVRIGAQINQYDDAPPGVDDNTVNPYADANLTWTYLQGSYAQLGVRHSRTATDTIGFQAGFNSITLDQEATLVYASVNHQITPKLIGSLLGNYQHGTFEGGSANSQSEDLFSVGVNLTYEINKFLAAETGYNYDRLSSYDPGRTYTRNRVYVGVRASY